jgi:predicted Zn finger-like uncharacterized protein
MIIVCSRCSSRLQVDEAKAPVRPFTIRCPKCNANVDAGTPTPAVEQSAITVGGSPAASGSRFEHPAPAPLFELNDGDTEAKGNSSATEQLVQALSGLLAHSGAARVNKTNARPSWDLRKALVCVLEENREGVARSLAENNYQVFVAQDTRQAVDRMRENQLDVVILDPRFDPTEQGSVYITREVNILRPAQRRRLFLVLLSPSLRTLDGHTAFLNNANAIINTNEIDELPRLLDQRIHAYNELYKEFNLVLGEYAL